MCFTFAIAVQGFLQFMSDQPANIYLIDVVPMFLLLTLNIFHTIF